MEHKDEHLKNLAEIRSLMEKSSRFISLSGLSGISAGIIALAGATIAFFYLDYDKRYFNWDMYIDSMQNREIPVMITVLISLALTVFILAFGAGVFFTSRKAIKNNQRVWDRTSQRLLYHIFVPLATGGVFCIVLLLNGIYFLIAPTTLVFYGLALLNGSKFTLNDIQYLGISEIILGLLSAFLVGYGLIFWAIGFGILHIVYGWIMFNKYEKRSKNA